DHRGHALQHHLLVRHDGDAEGHCAELRYALWTCDARRADGVWSERRNAALHAALFEHDAREFLPRARLGRHGCADEEVRCGPVSRTRAKIPCHTYNAGAGSILAPDGARGFRLVRSLIVPDEILHLG